MRALVCMALMLAVAAEARGGDAEAVATLQGLKAHVVRDKKLPGEPVTVVYVAALKKEDVKKAMDAIRQLKELRRLLVSNSEIGDEGAKGLGALKELRYLHLYGNRLTDAWA